MRMSRWQMVVAVLVVTGLVFGLAWADETQMCVPMGDIELKSISGEAERSAVTFPHAVHFSYSCQQCHHKWDLQKPISGCSATGCHDLAKAPVDKDGKPSKDTLLQARYFKNAYHAMCIGCHKEIKKQNKILEATQIQGGEKLMPTGPTGCIQCHPEE